MKLNQTNRAGLSAGIKKVCAACYQKVAQQINAAKEAIFAESYNTLHTDEHLLRLALNEAEAAAFETEYPHLFFPTLAMEKAQSVIAWHRQQQAVRPNTRLLAWAA